MDALVDGDFRRAAAQLAADQHPDVEELAVRVHAELSGGMVTRGPARYACSDDGGQTELSDHPQRCAADVRSATFSGPAGTAEIVHGLGDSRAHERRCQAAGWARRRTSRRVKEARADHKVRASSSTPEADGEWLEPVFI